MVTMATRDLVPGTRVVPACVPAVKGVDINTVILVDLTHGLTGSSVTAARDTQVMHTFGYPLPYSQSAIVKKLITTLVLLYGSRNVTNATVRLRAGSPPQLSQLIQTRRFRCFGHVERTDTSLDITRALKVSIRGLPKDWRHPHGRPRHTLLRTLDADLQPHNFGINSAWKYAQDLEHWKHLVETATLQLGAWT